MDVQGIGLVVVNVVAPFISVLIIAILGLAFGYLRSKNKVLKESHTVISIEGLIKNAVKWGNQTYVDKIKAASVDGKLTKDEQKYAFNMVFTEIKRQITKGQYDVLRGMAQDVNDWLGLKTEAEVGNQKLMEIPIPYPLPSPPDGR